jgi:Zn finger protein HypA/HybF involved in hydrogenase expression
MTTITAKQVKCLRCGNDWVTLLTRPRYCPVCKSPKWDVERSERKDSAEEANK